MTDWVINVSQDQLLMHVHWNDTVNYLQLQHWKCELHQCEASDHTSSLVLLLDLCTRQTGIYHQSCIYIKKGPLDTAINYKKYETIVLWAYRFIKKHQMNINQTRKESHLECNIFIIIIIIIISFQFKTSLTLQAKGQNSWFSSKVQSFPLGIETFYHCNEVHRSEKLLLWITQTVKHLLPIIIKYTTQDHIF